MMGYVGTANMTLNMRSRWFFSATVCCLCSLLSICYTVYTYSFLQWVEGVRSWGVKSVCFSFKVVFVGKMFDFFVWFLRNCFKELFAESGHIENLFVQSLFSFFQNLGPRKDVSTCFFVSWGCYATDAGPKYQLCRPCMNLSFSDM